MVHFVHLLANDVWSCRKDGNPFNASAAPSPPPISLTKPPPASPFFGAPASVQTPRTSGRTPGKKADGPSATEESNSKTTKKSLTSKRVVWISIAAVLSFIILMLALILFLPSCFRQRRDTHRISKPHEIAPYVGNRENPRDNGSSGPEHHHQKGTIHWLLRLYFVLSIKFLHFLKDDYFFGFLKLLKQIPSCKL